MRFLVVCLCLKENEDMALHTRVSGRQWPGDLGSVPDIVLHAQLGHPPCVPRGQRGCWGTASARGSLGWPGTSTEPTWDQGPKRLGGRGPRGAAGAEHERTARELQRALQSSAKRVQAWRGLAAKMPSLPPRDTKVRPGEIRASPFKGCGGALADFSFSGEKSET